MAETSALEDRGTGDADDLMQAEVRRFVDERIRPLANHLDAEQAYPEDIYRDMASLNMFGATIPEAHGGLGANSLYYLRLMEELARGYASIADQVGLVELVASLISAYGSDDQRDQYLKPLLNAERRCAYALTEPDAGSDIGGIQTRATRVAGGWRLSGEKVFIHNAPVADFAVILAVSDPERRKRGGMSAFLVDLHKTPGVSTPYREHKMGQRASQVGGIKLDDAMVAREALLGEEGQAFYYMMGVLAKGRLGIAGLSLGISRAALEAARRYAMTRRQFGAAIGQFQGVSFPLATMATEYEAGRLLAERAARLLDSADKSAAVACSMAKLFASEACVRHTNAAVQIHGGSGYIHGVEVERLYRDARITTIYEGTSEMQRVIIGRSLLV